MRANEFVSRNGTDVAERQQDITSNTIQRYIFSFTDGTLAQHSRRYSSLHNSFHAK